MVPASTCNLHVDLVQARGALAVSLDNDAVGVPLFLVCSIICALVARTRLRRLRTTRPRCAYVYASLWTGLALLFSLVALNKCAPILQHLSTSMRTTLRSRGWYADRQALQSAAIVVIAFGSGLVLGIIGVLTRRAWKTHVPAIIALSMLFSYIAMRMTSHHLVDALFAWRFGEFTLGGAIEAAALSLAMIAALADLARPHEGSTQHA